MLYQCTEQFHLPEFTIKPRSTHTVFMDAPNIPPDAVLTANALGLNLPNGVFFSTCYLIPQTRSIVAENNIGSQIMFTFGNLSDEEITVLDKPLPFARVMILAQWRTDKIETPADRIGTALTHPIANS